MKKNLKYQIILASNSPRRKQILKEAGYSFQVRTKMVDETYPSSLPAQEVARYIAEKKARQSALSADNELIITADTIVKLGEQVLGKPKDTTEATQMLQELSGRCHEVITGVCLKSKSKTVSFDDITEVRFRELSAEEISHYIQEYQPFDKAGAYGIQEGIGMIGIESIQGSYFNVMGLPIHKTYQYLQSFR